MAEDRPKVPVSSEPAPPVLDYEPPQPAPATRGRTGVLLAQLALMFFGMIVLDGGQLLLVICVAFLFYWAIVLTKLLRERKSLNRVELFGAGIGMVLALAEIIALCR